MSAIAEDVLRTGTLGAANDVVELAQPGTATVMVQLVVTNTNTTTFEVNVNQGDSPTWVAIPATNVNTGVAATTATASGIYRCDVAGCREFRVRCSAYTSGNTVVTMNGSVAPSATTSSSSSSGTVVDTELPAAVALDVNNGNDLPATTVQIASMQSVYDAATSKSVLMRAAKNFSDGSAGGTASVFVPIIWNGTTFDRWLGPEAASGTVKMGAAGLMVRTSATQYDPCISLAAAVDNGANGNRGPIVHSVLWNGTTYDRQRNNNEATLLSSAARTTTQTGSDITTYNARGIHVILDMTVVGTGSVTLEIQGKDPASGKYYALLTGAVVNTNSTNVYKIYPGLTAATNAVANDHLPRTIRINVTANNANSATYSVGYCLLV